MTSKLTLYDLREQRYPNKRGDTFRSLQVFECWVCGALTNLVIMGGSVGYGVRAVCPNSAECWHHVIEDKLRLSDKPHPTSYKRELETEIEQLRAARRAKIKNDITGQPDMTLKEPVTNVRSFKREVCEHYLDW